MDVRRNVGGMYNRVELDRSDRLNVDPIMELKHVIGYQSDKCTQVKWSRAERESVVIFSTGGALVAMDTEQNGSDCEQRFFFGHSEPVVCFDVSKIGNMVASAQEGKRRKAKFQDQEAKRRYEEELNRTIESKNYRRAQYDDDEGKGKPALIRLWDYSRARCITMMIMPVIEM